jgi:AraC-like DNA-binding protein
MGETFNALWECEGLFEHWTRRVRDLLSGVPDVGQKIALIQEQLIFLLRKNDKGDRLVRYCVELLRSSGGRLSIKELEQDTGYSRRYLSLVFREHVGLSPKVLAGIFRFQTFYRKWAEGQPFDLIKEDLYEYYYDQSHFTKEFRKMTGYSPAKFRSDVVNEFGRRLLRH